MTITKEMSINYILELDKNIAKIFMRNGIHCLSCPHAMSESIEAACTTQKVNTEKVISDINKFLIEKEN